MKKREIVENIRDGNMDIYSTVCDSGLDNGDLLQLIIELDCALVAASDALANAIDKTSEEVRSNTYGDLADSLIDAWTDDQGYWDDEGQMEGS